MSFLTAFLELGRSAFRGIYNYSGARFIVYKFLGKRSKDPDFNDPPSGVIWLIGVYLAAFGFSQQQYSSAIRNEQLLTAASEGGYSSGIRYCDLANRYNEIVTAVPRKPDWQKPLTVVESLFGEYRPSSDPTLTEARELERTAALTLGFADFDLGGPSINGRLSGGLLLNMPRTKQVMVWDIGGLTKMQEQLYAGGELTEVQREEAERKLREAIRLDRVAIGEPVIFENAVNASDINSLCSTTPQFYGGDTELNPSLIHQCTSVILNRACEELEIRKGRLEVETRVFVE